MLTEAEISAVSRHKISHDMGMCTCPCFEALIKVGELLKQETALRARLAATSPELLAAITLANHDEGDIEPDNGEGA